MPLLAYPRRQPSALLGGAIILLPAAGFCYGYAVWGREDPEVVSPSQVQSVILRLAQ